MTDKHVEFFWDVASPYTYLAATQMDALAQRTGAVVQWRPFLLGGVFKATGNQMPAALPAKARYMAVDLQRWAQSYGVGFHFPKIFPMRSVLAQRVVCAAQAAADTPSRLPLALMHAYWVEGCDLAQPDEIARVCEAAALDADALLAAAGQPQAKSQLQVNTAEAVQRGAFGAPTFFVGTRMFWGNDRLPLLEACLNDRLSV
ncbi:MAG TPA: 2-hydroxychromene-2-carboxylate isomerase [Nevskiaceae bacterium]|nr:2-hydroxychromene-2-carboxylate isomerase [Nevskiaceae bacterium]